jgi:DNA-binding response OmpR family regulator
MARILIADDEEGFRFLLQRMLLIDGHEVRETKDGDSALLALNEFPADIALVDLFMPGKEGMETIIEIRRRFPGVKVIAMSGGAPKSGKSYLTVAARLGAHRTMCKPFSADELLAVIQGLTKPTTA